MSASPNDFQVLQTYDQLGEAVYEVVVEALVFDGPPEEPSPTVDEVAWAQEIAARVRSKFLSQLDAA